jgi:hypothetical protein
MTFAMPASRSVARNRASAKALRMMFPAQTNNTRAGANGRGRRCRRIPIARSSALHTYDAALFAPRRRYARSTFDGIAAFTRARSALRTKRDTPGQTSTNAGIGSPDDHSALRTGDAKSLQKLRHSSSRETLAVPKPGRSNRRSRRRKMAPRVQRTLTPIGYDAGTSGDRPCAICH